MSEGRRCGVYSEKQSRFTGVLEWSRPDGNKVLVTEVSDLSGHLSGEWDDAVDVGEVVEYVRRVREPSFDRSIESELVQRHAIGGKWP